MRLRGTALSFAAASLLSLAAVQSSGAEKVILDDDFGSFSPTLIMLLHSNQVELLGITTVAGNTWVETTTASVTTLMQRLGRNDIPIIAGAADAAPETTVVKMFKERQGPGFQSNPARQSFIWDEDLYVSLMAKPDTRPKQ